MFWAFDRNQDGKMEETEPVDTENNKFQYQHKTKESALYGKLDCKYSDAMKIIHNFTLENVSTTRAISITTLIIEKQLEVTGEIWRWVWASIENNSNNRFFCENSDYQDSNASEKINSSQLNTHLRALCFRFKSWWFSGLSRIIYEDQNKILLIESSSGKR